MIDGTAGTEHQGQIVAQYRKMNKWSREKLAEALHVDVSTVYRMERHSVIKNLKRRELLVGLLGIPAALIGLSDEPQTFITSPVLNDDRMTFFEHEMASRWEVYHTGGTIRANRGLDIWLKETGNFAQASQGTPWHERVLIILAMSYQLQGSVTRDMMDYDKAHTAYQQAYRIAQELNSPELIAAALARRGIAYIQQDKPEEAITYLQSALNTINGLGLLSLRGYILQGLSEAQAKAQQKQACWQSIGLAERVLERRIQFQGRTQNLFSPSSVVAQRGVDAVLLHDYRRAIDLIDKSLLTYDPTYIRGRSRLIAQKAEAYYGLGLVDTSVITAEEALTLGRSVGSNKTIARVNNLYTAMTLSSWRNEPVVARLGALLATSY